MSIFRNLKEIEMCQKHTCDWWTELVCYRLSIRLVSLIQNTKITPNQLTLLSAIIVIVASIIISFGNHVSFIIAAILIQIGYIFDCADGELARYKKIFSPLGPWLDSFTDRMKDFSIIAALTYRFSYVNDLAFLFGLYSFFLVSMYHHALDIETSNLIQPNGRLNIMRKKLKLNPFYIGEQYFLYSLFLILNRLDLLFYIFIIYGSLTIIGVHIYKYYQYRKHNV